MPPQWTTDHSSTSWLVERLPRFAYDVGSVVPHGFETYVRVFHPVESDPPRRWSEVARQNGRIAHPTMQFAAIRPARPSGESGDEPWVGSLHQPDLAVVADVVARHTTTPGSCWFAVWDGYGHLYPPEAPPEASGSDTFYVVWPGGRTEAVSKEVAESLGFVQDPGPDVPADVLTGPRLRLPNREYVLLNGTVAEAVDVHDLLGEQSPNLWWPDDRAWCVATEIDLDSTYVGGSAALTDALLACPDLEVHPVQLHDGVAFDSDHVNPPPPSPW